ncbi:unnamed protein product [Schistosoma margrebowiei]|uniref:Uncharacterized protein n=1 Tax=Schistosoma margrebowiei TaxID=48269 RepID=A0A3P8H8F8_9TREM|nr:unnamed protein product [Schistosoma margrebowiei]
MELVSWMYLHLRVDVHSGTRTQYHSFQKPNNTKCIETLLDKIFSKVFCLITQ